MYPHICKSKHSLSSLPNADILCESFKRGGLPPIEDKTLVPHLTLISKRKGNGIPEHTYSALVREEFGEQEVEALQFLPIHKHITLKESYSLTL